MIKGILFDMDGVLIDSEYYTAEASIRYFAKKGFVVKQEDFHPFYGTGEKGYFLGVASKFAIPFDLEEEKILIYDIFRDIAAGRVGPLPGVKEFIASCKALQLPLAVATSAGRYKMNINLDILGFNNGTFNALVSGEDIRSNKPDPEIFITAAKRLGLNPKNCLVIEDAPSGVKAARAAGCKCLALLTTFCKDDLSDADLILKDLSETTITDIINTIY